jgi:hypothetical protein
VEHNYRGGYSIVFRADPGMSNTGFDSRRLLGVPDGRTGEFPDKHQLAIGIWKLAII